MKDKLYFYQIKNGKIEIEEVNDFEVPSFVLDIVSYNANMFSQKNDEETLQYFKATVITKCKDKLARMNMEVQLLNEYIKVAKGE